MIKIYNPLNIDRRSVTALWEHSFGDTCEYIDFFLDNCPGYQCFAYYADNRMVSMFFLLDGELAGEKSKYLYAACTHTDYRKQGIMKTLIDSAAEYCAENGCSSIFLVPANEKLYSYYSKFGFIDSFRKKCLKINPVNFKDGIASDTFEIKEILEQKKRLLCSVEGFLFSDEVITYTIKEHLNNGGKIFSHNGSDGEILSFYYNDAGSYVFKELLTDYFDIDNAVYKHFLDNNAENIYISTPIVYNSKNILAEHTKCGMCLPLNDRLKNYLMMHSELYASMYLD